MNRSEFNEWFAFHCSAFRSIADWFARLGEEESERTLGHWFRVLRNVGLDEARVATEQLFSGEEPEPKSRDKIPSVIWAIAKGRRVGRVTSRESPTVYVDGEPVYECPLCEDDGRITLRVPAETGEPFPKAIYDTCFACRCRHGEFWVRQGYTKAPMGVKPIGTMRSRHARSNAGAPADLVDNVGVMPEPEEWSPDSWRP